MLQQIGTSGDGNDSISIHNQQSSPNTTTTTTAGGGAGSSGFSEDEKGRIDDGGRNSGGGNRWPRQETLALLKIRSEMDVAFRDSSLKGPLWDEVSRKLAELNYHRSAKKCKEKFENVYKYHKRTKDGRTSKADGKTYRFFDQLQALEGSPSSHHHQLPSLPPPPPPMQNTQISSIPVVVSPISMTVSSSGPNNVDPISVAAPAVAGTGAMPINSMGGFPFSGLNMSSNSSSSSTSSEDEPPERRRNRKRKWKEFFGKLMKEVIDKQEELQLKFIDTLERRERDRMAREEAWRMQEIAKMKREHELLVQERSMVAAKDAAVITFLQKITEQNPSSVIPQISAMQLLQQQQQQQQNHPPVPAPASIPIPVPVSPKPTPPMQQQQQQQQPPTQSLPVAVASPVPVPVPISAQTPAPPPPIIKNLDNGGGNGGGESILQPSPSRWPKAEINALINLRTTLDTKYQENGPKGPLWEEISSAMRKLGYNRNAKRCKEKWENINKYYKKVKESSKKRPEDSKTCPYFHQLDAIYREKAISGSNSNSNNNSNNPGFLLKPETQMAPIMARPEQQWPLPGAIQEQHHLQHHQRQHQQQQQQQQQQKPGEPRGIQDPHNADDDYDDDDEDEDDEEEGGDYEVVPNKTSSMAAVE